MRKIREVLRLRFELRLGQRENFKRQRTRSIRYCRCGVLTLQPHCCIVDQYVQLAVSTRQVGIRGLAIIFG